ncbi:hypothetical protein D3C78_1372990 [compost metagenome]
MRVGLQRVLDLLVQVRAQGLAIQLQRLRLATLQQHLAGEVETVLVGRQEVALDGQRLHLALPLHALTGRGLEHLRTVGLDQRGAGAHAVERDADQHGNDGQQAEAGQQGDLPLDGKSVEEHGKGSCVRRVGRGARSLRAFLYNGAKPAQLESGWINVRYCPGVEPVHFLKAL